MGATEWEWKELMLLLKRVQLELAEYAGRVDYPLGNESGIAKQLCAIVRQARLGITNGDYDSYYVGQKNRQIHTGVKDWTFRIEGSDLVIPRRDLGDEYFVTDKDCPKAYLKNMLDETNKRDRD